MRHGFTDEIDNGWSDKVVFKELTAEELAIENERVDAIEKKYAKKMEVKEYSYNMIRKLGKDPHEVARWCRSSGNNILKRLYGEELFLLVTTFDKDWCN